VNDWTPLFLGVIAVATAMTAIVQIAVLLAAGRLARRIGHLVDRIEVEMKPVLGHLDTIGREAARAASLAAGQVERADRLFADLVGGLGEAVATVQSAVAGASRESSAFAAGIRATINALWQRRNTSRRSRAEDEDALFI
jgi:uncharacterized protein YoxC